MIDYKSEKSKAYKDVQKKSEAYRIARKTYDIAHDAMPEYQALLEAQDAVAAAADKFNKIADAQKIDEICKEK